MTNGMCERDTSENRVSVFLYYYGQSPLVQCLALWFCDPRVPYSTSVADSHG